MNINLSSDFRAKQCPRTGPAGPTATDMVFSARARRAARERRAKRALTIAVALAAPLLALKLSSMGRISVQFVPGGAPVPAPEQAVATPLHIVTRRTHAPKVARDGIDFTATSATGRGSEAKGGPDLAAPKSGLKNKPELPR